MASTWHGLHSTLVINCVFNALLSSTAIVLNIITIQALRKTSSLSKTLKALLLSLAVSDLGAGLLTYSRDENRTELQQHRLLYN